MKTMFLAAVGCLLLTAPALAMTDAECTAVWTQADTNGDGVLSDTEAGRYMAMMRIANKAMSADGVITQAIFNENCKADIFKAAAVDIGAAGSQLGLACRLGDVELGLRRVAGGLILLVP